MKHEIMTQEPATKYFAPQGLKQNWEDLNRQYQGLSMVTDNITKKHRKERLEHAMRQLENHIGMLERYTTIYVANN